MFERRGSCAHDSTRFFQTSNMHRVFRPRGRAANTRGQVTQRHTRTAMFAASKHLRCTGADLRPGSAGMKVVVVVVGNSSPTPTPPVVAILTELVMARLNLPPNNAAACCCSNTSWSPVARALSHIATSSGHPATHAGILQAVPIANPCLCAVLQKRHIVM